MSAKNMVVAGDYKGGKIELKVRIVKKNEVFICKPGFLGGKVKIDKTTVAAYYEKDKESTASATSAVARGMVGATLLGPVGIAAALSAKKKSTHTVELNFADGKHSLIEVNDEIYTAIIENLF